MNLKNILVFTFLLPIGLGYSAHAQKKIDRKQQTGKSATPAPSQNKCPVTPLSPRKRDEAVLSSDDDSIEGIRQLLIAEYGKRKKLKQKKNDPAAKQILSVSWIGTDFNKVEYLSMGEMISLAVLTKGYNIGDTVNITIAGKDDESLMAGIPCNELTFVGIVNYNNLSFLKDLFTVEGEDEKIVIDPAWKERYYCK